MNQDYYVQDGRACFSPTLTALPDYAFSGRQDLTEAHIPGHILSIGYRCFENCRNLRRIILEEGIEDIQMEAFLGCSALEQLTVPDSAELGNYVFYGCSGLQNPIFSRSGKILYAYPTRSREVFYTVPAGTEEVHCTAFGPNPRLKEVIFREGLRELHIRAFCDSHVRRVVLPATLRKVPEGTFENCRFLKEVVPAQGNTEIPEGAFTGMESLPTLSGPLSIPTEAFTGNSPFSWYSCIPLPIRNEGENTHGDSFRFRDLAEECAKNREQFMLDFAEHFLDLNRKRPHPFFIFGAMFWTCRAYAVGCGREEPLTVLWHRALTSGSIPRFCSGRFLRDLGFLFFDPDREYTLSEYDGETGIALVRSPCAPGRDPGCMETKNDWYYLSPRLTLLSDDHCILHRNLWSVDEDNSLFRKVRRLAESAWEQMPEF